jgi:tetratricopeptide (TPR) repeat protein
LGDTAGETAALTAIAEHEADAVEPVTRLLTLATAAKDWPAVARWAEAWIAINPLAAAPWRALLTTHEQGNAATGAIEDARVLLQLDPPDLPSIHYRLAKQLQATGDLDGARRNVLQALEDAPRFRAAYELLAKLRPATGSSDAGGVSPPPDALNMLRQALSNAPKRGSPSQNAPAAPAPAK